MGPCVPLLLQWVHYNHWPIILDPSNSIGILLMFVQLIFTVCSYYCFSNLAKDDGYKLFVKFEQGGKASKVGEEKVMENTVNMVENNNGDTTKSQSVNTTLKDKEDNITSQELFTNFDTRLVILSSGFTIFITSMLDLQINITCLYALNWTLTKVSIATGVASVIHCACTFFSYDKIFQNNRNIFYFNLTSYTGIWMNVFTSVHT